MKMPSYASILSEIKKKNPNWDSASDIVISKRLFDFLLKIAVSASDFDENFYIQTHPDIKAAIGKGVIKSGREHFVNTGYKEGRRGAMPVVDEKWYREYYKDVDQAIKSGKLPSAADHYRGPGSKEGRAANAAELQDLASWKAMLGS